jgi:4-amino-4-deoxy-L-arabinose transferase-like glycosyltransferase
MPVMRERGEARWCLLAVVVLGAVLRVAWLGEFGRSITTEGTEYASLARSLLAGRGYQGIFGGPHSLFPPLLPMLLAVLSPLAGDAEHAMRLVNMLAGIGLVPLMFRVGRLLGGAESGLFAALLVAAHGLFVALSAATYSESTFSFVLALALQWVLLVTKEGRARHAALAGVALGCAYLIRPEAAGYAAVAAVWVLGSGVLTRRSLRLGFRHAFILVILAAAVAAPYVGWLSMKSGYLRVEGKGLFNGIIAARMAEGMSYAEAARGLGPNLEREGPFLYADQFAVESLADEHRRRGGMTGILLAELPGRALSMARFLPRESSLGGLAFFALAAIGFLALLSRRSTWLEGSLFVALGLCHLIALSTLRHTWDRYLFAFAFFTLPLAGVGGGAVLRVARNGIASSSLRGSLSLLLTIAMVVSVAIPSWMGAIGLAEFAQGRKTMLKEGGLWLRSQAGGGKRIFATRSVLPYYAQGTLLYFPWSDGERALKYVHEALPDFLVLDSLTTSLAPYLEEWLRNGVPDPCAIPIASFTGGGGEKLVILKWSCR